MELLGTFNRENSQGERRFVEKLNHFGHVSVEIDRISRG